MLFNEQVEPPYVSSLTDSRCLVTTEAIMLDGANSVCGASRHPEQWQLPGALLPFIAVTAAVAVAAVLFCGKRAVGRWAVVAFALSCAPGLWAVLITRADAPGRVYRLAAEVAQFGDALSRFHQGRKVLSVQNECLECQAPLLFVDQGKLPECRAAADGKLECLVPPNRTWTPPDGTLVLRPDALRGACTVVGATLTCGQ